MKLQESNGEMAWTIDAHFIIENSSFDSVTSIYYDARVDNSVIYYKERKE